MNKFCSVCGKELFSSLDEFGDPVEPVCISCWLRKEDDDLKPENSSEAKYAYISVHSCGQVIGISVDTPDHKEMVAEFIAGEILNDCKIEHLPIDEANRRFQENFGLCKCFGGDK